MKNQLTLTLSFNLTLSDDVEQSFPYEIANGHYDIGDSSENCKKLRLLCEKSIIEYDILSGIYTDNEDSNMLCKILNKSLQKLIDHSTYSVEIDSEEVIYYHKNLGMLFFTEQQDELCCEQFYIIDSKAFMLNIKKYV